jgi:hypothetical protein
MHTQVNAAATLGRLDDLGGAMKIQLEETVLGSASRSPAVALTPQARRLLEEPVLATLLRLAVPTMVAVMRRELGLCGEGR